MRIRPAAASDLEAIRALHRDAFGDEGMAVARLALDLLADDTARPVLALVAEAAGELVGSVIFSTVRILDGDSPPACILAPLAVARHAQRRGVGKALVRTGLGALRERGVHLVFVLGDPGYYGQFGFRPGHRVRPPHELPYPEAWMALELAAGALEAARGRLACARCLEAPEHW